MPCLHSWGFIRLISVLIATLWVAIPASAAYRWVDAQGKVHYSDTPPPSSAGVTGIEQKRLSGSVIETERLSYATRQAMKKYPVRLYVAPSCDSPCDAGRAFLKRIAVPYTEKQVSTPEEHADYKKNVGEGNPWLPTLQVGQESRRGFEEGAWGSLLRAAQYPLGGQE